MSRADVQAWLWEKKGVLSITGTFLTFCRRFDDERIIMNDLKYNIIVNIRGPLNHFQVSLYSVRDFSGVFDRVSMSVVLGEFVL